MYRRGVNSRSTLNDCILQFMAKAANQRHLYEIRTARQGEMVIAVLAEERIVEIARLRDFLYPAAPMVALQEGQSSDPRHRPLLRFHPFRLRRSEVSRATLNPQCRLSTGGGNGGVARCGA